MLTRSTSKQEQNLRTSSRKRPARKSQEKNLKGKKMDTTNDPKGVKTMGAKQGNLITAARWRSKSFKKIARLCEVDCA